VLPHSANQWGASGSTILVEHKLHKPKVKGLIPGATRRKKNTEKTKKVTASVTEEFNEVLHTFRISVAQDKSVST
jgi:hypothetical protein